MGIVLQEGFWACWLHTGQHRDNSSSSSHSIRSRSRSSQPMQHHLHSKAVPCSHQQHQAAAPQLLLPPLLLLGHAPGPHPLALLLYRLGPEQ